MKEQDDLERWLVAMPPVNTVMVGVGVDLAGPLAEVPYVPLAIDRSLAATGREPMIVRLVVHGGQVRAWVLSTREELEEYVRPVTEPALVSVWDQLRETHQDLRGQSRRVSGPPGSADLVSRACRVVWLSQGNDALLGAAVRAIELLTVRMKALPTEAPAPSESPAARAPSPTTAHGDVVAFPSAAMRPEARVPRPLGPQRHSRGVAR